MLYLDAVRLLARII